MANIDRKRIEEKTVTREFDEFFRVPVTEYKPVHDAEARRQIKREARIDAMFYPVETIKRNECHYRVRTCEQRTMRRDGRGSTNNADL